ncbi:hypothetical protein PPYR_00400 [Photinus pyralis]|uniref:Glycosyl-hydrolase family 116 N-terminal domain-containing protein n=1 Tax=Photinus pyralis TaxID=7054 RepID=A0A5N4B209_PHOPY|nr:non-lysosomal glucosylceramidase-like [Photinus pyralis]KAB0803430.1 hypothetical protein PPYR_00400 [Photinus pyralis]
MEGSLTAVSKYGFKLSLDSSYPENWPQAHTPRWKQIWDILPMIIRYLLVYIKTIICRHIIVMDYIKLVRSKQIYGVPLGGIGVGTIGRGFRGEFCRYQLKPGNCDYSTLQANEFIITIKDAANMTIFQSTLSTYKHHYRSTYLKYDSFGSN